MVMKEEDFILGKSVVDSTIGISTEDIDSHIRNNLSKITSELDLSVLENRRRIFDFLSHMSALYLNFCLNGHSYLLSEDEIEKCYKGRNVIVEVIQELRR